MVFLLTGSSLTARAQQSTPPLPPLPPPGNYYSWQHAQEGILLPPLPAPPFPDLNLPVYQYTNGVYIFDDRSVEYTRVQTEDASGPPIPPGGGGGGGGSTNPPCCSLNYNPATDLWIEVTGIDADSISLRLHNTTTGLYQLLSKTDLNQRSWTPGEIIFNTSGFTNLDFSPVARAGFPIRFFEAVKGTNVVSIFAESPPVASEPGPNNNPPAVSRSFTISRDIAGSSQTVFYRIGGTADNGVDYTTIPASVTFGANQSQTNILIQPLFDNLLEFDENVILTLIPTNGYVVDPGGAAATITIRDFHTNLFTLVAEVPTPIGIDYSPTTNALLVSVNFNFIGNNFDIIRTNGAGATVITNWSGITNLGDEVKLATVKTTANGFTQGEMYFGSGVGTIGRLNASGTVSNLNWATLPGVNEGMRGSLYVDQTGIWSNNLIAVTSDSLAASGGVRTVWRIESDGTNATPHLIASIATPHLEGVITLTNDFAKWGPWAGKIITGDEDILPESLIYAIDATGTVTPYALGIDSEDFDIILPDQDLYCVIPGGAIFKLSRTLLTNYVGDLLVTESGENFTADNFPRLSIVHWNAEKYEFEVRQIPLSETGDGEFEHVTFAPISLPNIQ